MSDKALRKALIKLAHDKPEIRGDILPLLKKGAYDRISAYATEQGLVLWVSFAGYGLVHHLTGPLTRWEKLLRKAQDKVLAQLTANNEDAERYDDVLPISFRRDVDIVVDGNPNDHRELIMETWFKADPMFSWGPDEVAQAKVNAEMAGIRDWTPLHWQK
jgi:hypothetical protein